MRNAGSLFRNILSNSSRPDQWQQLVFRGDEPFRLGDRWMKQIVELADGRPISDISRLLFLEELGSGAGFADIGLWRNQFDQEVTKVLGEMSDRGYIRLTPPADRDRQ